MFLRNRSVRNLKSSRRKTQTRSSRVFSFLVTTHENSACCLIFTLGSTLQGKGCNIFSLRLRLVRACLAPTSRCQSEAAFESLFSRHKQQNRGVQKRDCCRRSDEETTALIKLSQVCFFVFVGSIDGSSHTVAAAMSEIPPHSQASLPGVCAPVSIQGNTSSAHHRLFHYENIDHQRESWCQYSYN